MDFFWLDPTIPRLLVRYFAPYLQEGERDLKTFNERWKLRPLDFHESQYPPTPHP
jgi:hypothetical protein